VKQVSVKVRVEQLERNANAGKLYPSVYFVTLPNVNDDNYLSVLEDIAFREAAGQKVVVFEVVHKQRPIRE
jgi:hypothetical protein